MLMDGDGKPYSLGRSPQFMAYTGATAAVWNLGAVKFACGK